MGTRLDPFHPNELHFACRLLKFENTSCSALLVFSLGILLVYTLSVSLLLVVVRRLDQSTYQYQVDDDFDVGKLIVEFILEFCWQVRAI